MINRTRITVDEATREVLDQLSAQLEHEPSWAAQLKDQIDQIREGTRDVVRQAQAPSTKLLEELAATTRSLQSQAAGQSEGLPALSGIVQVLNERIGAQMAALEGIHSDLGRLLADSEQGDVLITRQDEIMAVLRESLGTVSSGVDVLHSALGEQSHRLGVMHDSTLKQADLQQRSLDELQQGQDRLASTNEQYCATAVQQHDAIDTIRQTLLQTNQQLERSQAESNEALEIIHALLLDLRAERVTQARILDERISVQRVTLEGLHSGLSRLLVNSEHVDAITTRQGEVMTVLHESIDEVSAGVDAVQTVLGEHSHRLGILYDSAEKQADLQQRSLDDLQQGQDRLDKANEKFCATAVQQLDAIDSLRQAMLQTNQQLQRSQAESNDCLKAITAVLHDMRAMQVAQSDALQSVAQSIGELSVPWWKKIFQRARSN